MLDLTYTGSKGTHLASDRVNIMQIDPKYAYLGTLLNSQIDDPEVVALGFRPPFANFKQLMGGNATLGQALRPFPQYTGVSTGGMMNHSGNSTYNALIVKATKRFSGGLSLLASYTWSKLLIRCGFIRTMDRRCRRIGCRRRRGAGSVQPGTREIVWRARPAAHVQADRQL